MPGLCYTIADPPLPRHIGSSRPRPTRHSNRANSRQLYVRRLLPAAEAGNQPAGFLIAVERDGSGRLARGARQRFLPVRHLA